MQTMLVNPKITSSKIMTYEEYKEIPNIHEFILYSDNILEGITLLNSLTVSDDILSFYGVIYEPVHQPVYLFKDTKDRIYSIKICGAYKKWELPACVDNICNYVDLPDYVIYSITSGKSILAGENTETASVGNSQWQREGRKLGAAKQGVPFIYQTFYSGLDASQNTIREPTSLQVYNQLLYSIRYKTPSFVAYFENNFEGAMTRKRIPVDSQKLFENYIKSVLVSDIDKSNVSMRRGYEKEFFMHMIGYLQEGKYGNNFGSTQARIKKDFPIINKKFEEGLLKQPNLFVDALDKYIYGEYENFIKKYPVDELNLLLLKQWQSYNNKPWVSDLLNSLKKQKSPAMTYASKSKVGIARANNCKKFLLNKFPEYKKEIERVFCNKYSEAIIIPLRIYKLSGGKLTFSPDPESGEIVAFCELFGYDYNRNKTRVVIGYGIVETPKDFDWIDKKGTKLYNSVANYIDIFVLNNSKIITKLDLPKAKVNKYKPVSISSVKPNGLTEEMAIVSTYLNETTINAKWSLCFIHTHHSSWQQMVIHGNDSDIQRRIDRVSTKVDLIMQDKSNTFMVAEGKNAYSEILSDKKIKKAMKDAGKIIDDFCKNSHLKFDAFIYNLPTTPDKEPDYYADMEYKTVKGAIERGHFTNIAYETSFVVIIVYMDEHNKTKFKLVYSPKFDENLKKKLDKEFKQ